MLEINIALLTKPKAMQNKSPIFNTQNNNVSLTIQAQRAEASNMIWGFEVKLGD